MNKQIVCGWLVSAFVTAVLNAPLAMAEPGFYESEPNNTPAEANPVAGEVTIYGSMVKGDQDGFLWTVSDDDARKLWTFELHGIPGALTIAEIVRVEYAENGSDVASIERLVKMGTRDGLTPSIHRDMLFEPGEYLIGIAYAGGGNAGDGGGAPFRPPVQGLSFGDDGHPGGESTLTGAGAAPGDKPGAYRLLISEGTKIYISSDNKPRNSRDNAKAIRPSQAFTAFEGEEKSWYSLTFDDKAATQRWNIEARAPVGRQLGARLVDADGKQLATAAADDKGHLGFFEMAPAATTWYLELHNPEAGFIRSVSTTATGQRVSGEELEPNDSASQANHVNLSQPLTGRIAEGDRGDYFQFSVDETMADRLHTLRVESTPPVRVNFCLANEAGKDLHCRQRETPVELRDLMLAPGEWQFSVTRANETEYRVTMTDQGPAVAGVEVEPNDLIDNAIGIPENFRIKGAFNGDDNDYYQIMIPGDPQLWRFQVIGDELFELHYYDGSKGDKASIRATGGQRRLQLENLFLLPGRHYLRVSGRDGGSYTLLARALGPPDPDGEIEPNDQSNMQRLAMGQTRRGLLSEQNDQDYYRFFLANTDHVRLTIQPPPDGQVDTNLYWYHAGLGKARPGENGEPVVIEGLFPPGDYHVWLRPKQISDAEYTIQLERLPRFSCPADCEPNGFNSLDRAAQLPPDLVLQGKSGDWNDWDYYQLPAFDTPTELVIHASEPVHELAIGTLTRKRERLEFDAEQGVYRVTVPTGEAQKLMLDSRQTDYRLQLEFPGGQVKPLTHDLQAALELGFDTGKVSAFRTDGQQVHGDLKLKNTGDSVLQLELEAATSDYRWSVTLDKTSVAMAAGGSANVPVNVQAPADAWADRSVVVSVRARDAQGAQVETAAEIAVDRDIAPVDPFMYWPLPAAILGGINIAWSPLGAEWAGEQPKGSRLELLRDNLVFPGAQVECCGQHGGWERGQEPAFTLKLPGTESMPVAGVALNHFGTTNPFKNIRKATLLLSSDGIEFNEAMRLDLLPVLTAQYFALENPVPARFARLRIDDTYEERDGDGRAFFSEWKVILQPGFDPSAGAGYNIANPDLGGHLVWDWPPEPYSPARVLVEGDASNRAGTRREPAKDYIIGFNHNRAAQITRLEWQYRDGLEDRWKQFGRVVVSASLGSPVGPWQELGEMDLSGQKNAASLELPEATWVRYVRFTAYLAGEATFSEEPGVLKIWERPTSADYLSVLGEWGEQGNRGYYEQLAGVQAGEASEIAGNNSRATAADLQAGNPARGQVSLGKQEHWYRHRVSGSDNTLLIELTGDPTVRAVVAVEDEAGNAVPLRRTDRKDVFNRQEFEAIVEPGSEVWLRISEPPRNVVFTWDTSASVNAYIPQINNSLVAFSGEVVPGREAVNLMPFSMGPLLEEWYGEPYKLQTILNDYRRIGSSSSAEETMKRATLELAPLAGTKAMVVITDAQTPHDGELWGPLQTVRPRIFGIGVAGADMADQNRFRDWASVNAGTYNQLIYDGEMEVAFDRASTLMHRPAGYSVRLESEHREAPGPGMLQVVDNADKGTLAGAAVELILDASGSMLQRMDGKRRIAVAKEVLTEAVLENIPAGTPVALRVFGHKQADACRTDLEIPLQPLDPKAAAAKIAGIQAMNLARTPIADSLKAVKSDLKDAASGAAVVLVTDGEETCEGDPAKVIEALQADGMQINLNIVGFAIDNVELAEQFRSWAEMGGGRYFAANNQEGLSESLGEALKVSYTVYDQGGNEIATGQVGGEPLELEQGFYRVVVHSLPQQAFDKVEIRAEREKILELQ